MSQKLYAENFTIVSHMTQLLHYAALLLHLYTVFMCTYSCIQTLTLTSKCACPGGCNEKGPTGGGGSSGGSHHSEASKIGIPGLLILSM